MLVTGGAGFIGSNFVRYVCSEHDRITVVNIDRLTYCSRTPEISSPRYHFYPVNLRDAEQIRRILNDHEIDTVVHFAAQTHVDRSFGNSLVFTDDNVKGTHTLLECVRAYGKVRRFLHMSTDEVYGEVSDDHAGCVEQSLLNPTNPYAATKAAAEFLVRSYGHSFDIPFVITRGNNVYGEYQFPDKIIPKFIRHLLAGEKLPIHGDGSSRRNFVHVMDVCSAVWAVLIRADLGSIYNIGSEDEFSVMEVAHELVNRMTSHGDVSRHLEYVRDREFNDRRYCIDATKLKELGWEPKISFDDGLSRAISWYVANTHYWDVPKKWLVFGWRGWIGQKYIAELTRMKHCVILAQSRADKPDDVAAEVEQHGPDFVVSLIGRTHGPGFGTIDYLEQKGKLVENLRDNLYAPVLLARAAEVAGAHFTYLGTGCIFTREDGVDQFTEDSMPNFFGSQYSTVKSTTDQLMGMFPNALNCRIRMPISTDDSPRNLISKLVKYKKIHSVRNSMSVLEDVIPAMIDLALRGVSGTVNMTNPGVIEHAEILEMYKRIIDPSKTWETFTEEELASVVAAPRSNNELDTTRLTELCPSVPDIHTAVERTLTAMKERSSKLTNGKAYHPETD